MSLFCPPIPLVLLLVPFLALALPLLPLFFQLHYLICEVVLLEEVIQGPLAYHDVLGQDSEMA